jgi:hypothetical protein
MTFSASNIQLLQASLGKWCREERRVYAFLAFLLLVIGVIRIVATYDALSQAYDEPADIVAGMEWLDKGTYTLNLEHPPLSTVAAAVGPFLAGLRLQAVPVMKGPSGGTFFDLTTGGNNILHWGGNYWHTLRLARLGLLPFFLSGVLVVFFWTREIVGGVAAVMAVLLFTTLPPILAFSGLAYTDLSVAVLIVASIFVFTHWLERPRLQTTVLFGIVTALAVLANFPALLFLPICWAAVALCWLWFRKKGQGTWSRLLQQAGWALVVFSLVLWAGYRFSVAPLNSLYARPAQDISSLHLSVFWKRVLYGVVAANPPVPAPAFLKGISAALIHTGASGESYLLGHIRHGGWWYYYLVGLGVKSPLPFLLLAAVGAGAMVIAAWRENRWMLLVPLSCAAAVLIVMMRVRVDRGIRHILCVYFFLAIVAGYGAARLWAAQSVWHRPARIVLIGLLAWQIASTSRSHPDYLAYFNEIAGQHPEKFLLWGCDYDCGQDTGQLARLLQEYKVSRVALRVYTSADFARLGFPPFQILNPYEQKDGWVAASVSAISTGDTHWAWPGTESAPTIWHDNHPDAFRWLMTCQPFARVGRTIFLYEVPCGRQPDQLTHPAPGQSSIQH